MTQTNIIVNLRIEGIHNWPDAKKIFPEVGFLSDSHRHIFYICAKKEVSHDDRDVEIILFKRLILKYFHEKYNPKYPEVGPFKFGAMSCEMIARELLEEFQLEYCSVLEDNENGAEIYKKLEPKVIYNTTNQITL